MTEGLGNVPRGRKPTFLNLNSDRCGIIGVDIRPITTTLAVASLDAHFVAQESIPTGNNPEEFISRLGRRITDLMRAHPGVRMKALASASRAALMNALSV